MQNFRVLITQLSLCHRAPNPFKEHLDPLCGHLQSTHGKQGGLVCKHTHTHSKMSSFWDRMFQKKCQSNPKGFNFQTRMFVSAQLTVEAHSSGTNWPHTGFSSDTRGPRLQTKQTQVCRGPLRISSWSRITRERTHTSTGSGTSFCFRKLFSPTGVWQNPIDLQVWTREPPRGGCRVCRSPQCKRLSYED